VAGNLDAVVRIRESSGRSGLPSSRGRPHRRRDPLPRGANETIVDRGTIGLRFAADRATRDITDLVLFAEPEGRLKAAPTRESAAGASSPIGGAASSAIVGAFRRPAVRGRTRLLADTYVWALQPRIVPGLVSIQVSARKPDGRTEILLFARDIAAEWPTPYVLERPVLLPRGTELSVSAHYANDRPADRVLLTISRYTARTPQPLPRRGVS
jgi:hypothetical protein